MKHLLILFIACSLSLHTYSQETPTPQRLTLQPRIGINLSDLTGSEYINSFVGTWRSPGAKIGLACGIEVEYRFLPTFSVAASLMYSNQGSKGMKYMHYLNIPIVANFYPDNIKGLALKAGIQYGRKVGYGAGKRKPNDLSIPIGLSYEYRRVVLDARYHIGITKIWDEGNVRNSVLQFTLGYKIPVR